MSIFLGILWFVGLLMSYAWVETIFGYMGLTGMFPEGSRWWHIPSGILAMAVFAGYILANPF